MIWGDFEIDFGALWDHLGGYGAIWENAEMSQSLQI